MAIVIGLHGAKGSGKDHFFKVARTHLSYLKVQKLAYADPIKNEVSRIFELQDEEQYDLFKRTTLMWALQRGQNYPDTVPGRQVVREIGMMMRSYDEQQFVKYVEDAVQSNPDVDVWCITDLRFSNELHSIKNNLNGLVVKILREGYTFDGHVTETEIDDSECDYVIRNGSNDIEIYNRSIITTMEHILETRG